MLRKWSEGIRRFLSAKSVGDVLLYGFATRLILALYSIYHDSTFEVKYTDIDYHVFTNGSRAILDGRSPFEDKEYRYSPLVALPFLPNVSLNPHIGKIILILADIVTGYLSYRLNIYQGTNRIFSKFYLLLWLFNPVIIGISTRGSFEPLLALVILASVYMLNENRFIFAGLLYGLAIHLKLYPIIYALSLYIYIIQRKPYLKTQTKFAYWLQTLSPGINHIKFFISTLTALVLSTYFSYKIYGQDYIEQSFIYHLKRKDLQHNFSVYFYLFKLFPNFQDAICIGGSILQFLGVLTLSISNASFDSNRRTKLKKLSFSLFSSTFLFVTLNKVCTSQYFIWYLTFIPLIADSLMMTADQAGYLIVVWLGGQLNWLAVAYMYQFKNKADLDMVGTSSLFYMISNLWILKSIYNSFDPNNKFKYKDESKDE